MRSFMVAFVVGSQLLVAGAASAAGLCAKKNGAVMLRTDVCRKKEAPIDPVALGLQGPQGPPGTSARTAVVAFDGSVIAQSGGITVTPVAAQVGYFGVAMGEDVSQKAVLLSNLGTGADDAFRGSPVALVCGTVPTSFDCSMLGLPNDNQTILVVTLDASNAVPESHGFYLAVP